MGSLMGNQMKGRTVVLLMVSADFFFLSFFLNYYYGHEILMKYKYICISSFSSSMEISSSRSTLSEREKGTKRFYWLKQGSSSSRSHNSSGTFSVSCDSWHEEKRFWQWEDITKGQTDTAYNGIRNSYKVSY